MRVFASGTSAIEATVVSLTAGGDVILSTQIEILTAEITGQGELYITELDALVLEEILNADGLIEITAIDGLIVWKQIKTVHGSVNLTSESDIEVIGEIIAQGTGAKIALTTPELVVIEGKIKAQDRIEIEAMGTSSDFSVYVNGTIETEASGSIDIQANKRVLIAGQVGVAVTGQVNINTTENLYILSEGQIKGQLIELTAQGEVKEINYAKLQRDQQLFNHPQIQLGADDRPTIQWIGASWYTTYGVQVDQIGWIDSGTMQEYEIGISEAAQILNGQIDYSNGVNLTRLYQASYVAASGEYHILMDGKEYVLVTESDALAENIAAEKIQRAPELEGIVYVERSVAGQIGLVGYVPEWSTEQNWKTIHASAFLGASYDSANPEHNFYIKIQIGADTYTDANSAVLSQIGDVTQENVGNTRLVTNVNLNQIGWWDPVGGTGVRDTHVVDGSFEKGEAKPGENWVAWYAIEIVESRREITLSDGRIYSRDENPSWANDSALTTQIINVSTETGIQQLYVEMPAAVTENIESIQWVADLKIDGGVTIPVDAVQIDNTGDYDVGSHPEYLGTWRDDWGTHHSGDAYSQDSGLGTVGSVRAGQDGSSNTSVLSGSIDDQGHVGPIEILNRYEGTEADTHEIWNRYSAKYSWMRDALYQQREQYYGADAATLYDQWRYANKSSTINEEGELVAGEEREVPFIVEELADGKIRELIGFKRTGWWGWWGIQYSKEWKIYSAKYKETQVDGKYRDLFGRHEGAYTTAETLIKSIGTVEVTTNASDDTGIKTLMGGEWDNGMYHEIWFHESDEYEHSLGTEARISTYDKVAWSAATASREWEQLLVGFRAQDQGHFEDNGSWSKLANVNAGRGNQIGDGNNDQWVQTLEWVSNNVQIDDFESRIHTNNNFLYTAHDLLDDRLHAQYAMTSVTEDTNSGDVQTAKEKLGGTIEGTVVNITAGGDIVLGTQVETLNAEITGSGELYIIESDALVLEKVLNADGAIEITAGGELIVWKEVKAAQGSVKLNSTDDMEIIGSVWAQGTEATIELTTPECLFVKGHVKAQDRVEIEAKGTNRTRSVYIEGIVEIEATGSLEIQADKEILIAGQIGTGLIGQLKIVTGESLYLLSNGQIQGQIIELEAQGAIEEVSYEKPEYGQRLFSYPQIEYNLGLGSDGQQVGIPSIQWIETDWFTTYGTQIDQIGWIDPETMQEYNAGVSGIALINKLLYQMDYSNGVNLTKLYQVGYIADSGEYHIIRDGKEYVLVEESNYLANNVEADKIQQAPEFEGFLYLERSVYEAHQNELTDCEYLPEWAAQEAWEIVHAKKFLGENYDADNPEHNFYVKMQLGAKTHVKQAVVSKVEAMTQENIGETRLVTNVELKQIGWWNPDTGVGVSDSLDLATSSDARIDGLFKVGEAKPGENWVAWYRLEIVSSQREIILTDGRIYSVGEDPTWANSPALTTQAIEITTPTTNHFLYVKIPEALSEDLEQVQWIADLTIDGGVSIPVDAVQIDETADYDIGEHAEYLGIWRDDWGTQHSGDSYSQDSGLRAVDSIIAEIANGNGEPGYTIITNWTGVDADRHEMLQDRSYAYVWEQDDWGQHIGATTSNTTGLDSIGSIKAGQDGHNDISVRSDSIEDQGHIGPIEVLDHYEGAGADTHEIWNQYSSEYNWTRAALYQEREGYYGEDAATLYDEWKTADKSSTINEEGDLVAGETRSVPLIVEELADGKIRELIGYEKTALLGWLGVRYSKEWKIYSAKYKETQMDGNGKYRDLLGSSKGAYTTAETDLSGRVIGDVENLTKDTTNDGTREFLGYEWNVEGTEYRENWKHVSDWRKDFSGSGKDVQFIYDSYIPTLEEQNATDLVDVWEQAYAGKTTTAESLIKAIGTVEGPVSDISYPFTGIKTLIGGEWDNGMYHEIWGHESDEYRHNATAEAQTSTYDKVAWEDATAFRQWKQVWVGYHTQDQGHYKDDGSWNELANVNAGRGNLTGDGNNDQWVQNLEWTGNLVRIDDLENRVHTQNDLLYNWHDLTDERSHAQYIVTGVTEDASQGNVQTVKQKLSGAIKGTVISITAGGDITLSTQTDTLNAEITGQGELYITELDELLVENVLNAAGGIEISTADKLIVWKEIKTIQGSIKLDADADIEVIGTVLAQGTGAKIELTTEGYLLVEGHVKAQDQIAIEAHGTDRDLSVYIKGSVEAREINLKAAQDVLIVTGQIGSEETEQITLETTTKIYLISGGQIKGQTIQLTQGEIKEISDSKPEENQKQFIHPQTKYSSGLGADGQQIDLPFVQWIETSWFTTHDTQLDQIGWINPETMQEFEAGVSGNPVIDNDQIDYSNGISLTKLYQATYVQNSGRYHILIDGIEYLLVAESDTLTENIASEKIKQAPELQGIVYVERDAYEACPVILTDWEYIPEWSTEQTWEIVHASEFLGANYDAANPDHNFYVKMQIGSKTSIARSVVNQIEQVTQEQIGETRIVTNVLLHQIGWWNPITNEGLQDQGGLANSPDARTNGLFEIGVAKPGEQWVAWYSLDVVDSQRTITLTDGRVYSYEEDPTWINDSTLTTQSIEISSNLLYVKMPAALTENLETTQWVSDQKIVGGVSIPVDAVQIDNTVSNSVGNQAEYLGTWGNDWGTYRSGDAYSHASGLREIGTVVGHVTNDKGEPGYAIITNWTGVNADRHEVLQNRSYAYIWLQKDWGQHVGAIASNSTGLDAIGTINIGEDGNSDASVLSGNIDDQGHAGPIEVLDHYEGIESDTHEIWNQYSAKYNWTRDALYQQTERYNGSDALTLYNQWKYADKSSTINEDGEVVAGETREVPFVVEQLADGRIRELVGYKRTSLWGWWGIHYSKEWKIYGEKYKKTTEDGSGKYRDLLGSYAGAYTTAETALSGRTIGEIENLSKQTTNDGTRRFLGYEWNVEGTEYRETWQHFSDWYKDFSVSGQDIQTVYDTYVPTADEQNAAQLVDVWEQAYAGEATNAETQIKPIGTVESVANGGDTGTKTLIGGEWDSGMYHELWSHESAAIKRYAETKARFSTYDKIAWQQAEKTREWEQLWVGSHTQDQGEYTDNGSWDERANVNADRDDPIGEGDNDQWIQKLEWASNLVHIDDFESRIHTRNNLLYTARNLLDDRDHVQYTVTSIAD